MEPTCIIVGAGDFSEPSLPLEPGGLLVAADGGYERVLALGAVPDLVVGDFDSLGYVPAHPHLVRHPVMKDDTDMMLAVREGLARGCRRFLLYGGLGGRLDHTLANIQTLAWIAGQGAAGFLVGSDSVLTAMRGGALRFDARYKGVLSVFCHGAVARGVTLEGLLYPLTDATLTPDVPLGVSNEFTGAPATVRLADGTLILHWQRQPELPFPERT